MLNSLFGSWFDSTHVLISNNQNLTLMGDANFQENGRLCLTTTSSSLPHSSSIGVGRAIYSHPIMFRNISSKSTASFLSKFTFTIKPNFISFPPLFGDGLTFIITSNSSIPGDGFGYMGLSNQSCQEHGMFIAVEFDTRFDPSLQDISDNHIGIDINSVFSYPTMDSTPMGFDLKNGKRTTVWIEYLDVENVFNVWLSYNDSKSSRPTLATRMDLSNYIDELMFIGFSASGERGTAEHIIHNWEFETYFPPFHSVHTSVKGGRLENDGDVSSLSFEVGLVVMLLVIAEVTLLVRLMLSMAPILLSAIYKLTPHQSANQTTSPLTTNGPAAPSQNRTIRARKAAKPDIVKESVSQEGELEMDQESSIDVDDNEFVAKNVIGEAASLEVLRPSDAPEEMSQLEYRHNQLKNASNMPVTKSTRKHFSAEACKFNERRMNLSKRFHNA
ncbi:hypothetical protein MKW98_001462 [Papaver atlanticum]|uniref:Legume lectin domain-containing protein n=1 Tax=Papaver atlanticum TaxID=357466 RepID=A0AAD4SX15_9MAGN|nr:hypothetical protein MKW98_001462 [Papaver atlanticum]